MVNEAHKFESFNLGLDTEDLRPDLLAIEDSVRCKEMSVVKRCPLDGGFKLQANKGIP